MKHFSCLLSIFCCLYPSAYAEDNQNQTAERIVVTASRTQEAIADIPSTIYVLDENIIQQLAMPGENLGSLLGKALPGLGMPSQSVTHFGQTLRGRDILILIDGIPQSENRQVSRQLNSMNPQLIERIEVVSGASAIYGAGAPGGIVNVITKNYSPAPFNSITSIGSSVASKPLANSSQSYHFQQTVSGSPGPFRYLLSAGTEQRNNSFDANGRLIAPEPAQTSRNDTSSFELLAKFSYNFTADQSLELNLQHFSEKQDTEYTVRTDPYRAVAGLELKQQPKTERFQAALTYENGQFLNQELAITAYLRNRTYRFFPFALTQPVPLVNQSSSKAEIWGVKAVINSQIIDKLAVIWGLDFENDYGSQQAHAYDYLQYMASEGSHYRNRSEAYDYGPDVDTQKLGLFSQFKWALADNWQSRFGIRFEQVKQKVHDFIPPLETALARNWSAILSQLPAETAARLPSQFPISSFQGGETDYSDIAVNLGLVYQLSPFQSLYWNASQGFELADTARLMREAVAEGSILPSMIPMFDPNMTIGTTSVSGLELDTIKTSNIELGWRGAWSNVFGSSAIYYNESDRVYRFNPDFTVTLAKQKKRVYGLETQLGWRILQPWTIGGSFNINQGEYRDKEQGKEKWLALSAMEASPPKWMVYTQYQWLQKYDVRLQLLGVEGYDEDFKDSKGPRIRGYSTLDASFRAFLSDSSQIRFAVSNLLNREYKTVFHQWAEETYGPASGAPASGRRLSLSYELNL